MNVEDHGEHTDADKTAKPIFGRRTFLGKGRIFLLALGSLPTRISSRLVSNLKLIASKRLRLQNCQSQRKRTC